MREYTTQDFLNEDPENKTFVVRHTDWDEASKVRAAAMIAEGGTCPESTDWEQYTLPITK